MALIAVLSNPASDGNRSRLDRIRDFCSGRRDILHIEVQRSEDVGIALNRISVARPDVLVLNGGDGTVQAVLTELFGEGSPDRVRPPIAVLPNGKTNLIAKDLHSTGDPIAALEQVIALAESGLAGHVVGRQLISLDTGDGGRPRLGMFLAAGALADVLLFCRHKLYARGVPNGLAHAVTLFGGLISVLTDWSSRFLPPKPSHIRLAIGEKLRLDGRFQVLMVTTLRTLVLSGKVPAEKEGTLQLLVIERRRSTAVRVVYAGLTGQLGKTPIPGVRFEMGDSIHIEDERGSVIMDGEEFVAAPGKAIRLTPTKRVHFVHLGGGMRATEPLAGEMSLIAAKPQTAQAARAALSDGR